MNCFRYLGFTSFSQVNSLTIPEYELLMKAVELRQADKDYRNHLQAFLNFSVKAERKVGKNKTRPVYTTFKKFFDYEKAIRKVFGYQRDESHVQDIGKLLRKEKQEHGREL